MSLETKIDIVVKNLNQLNKLADNLKGINASNQKLVKGLDQINEKLDRMGGKASRTFSGITRSAEETAKSVNKAARSMEGFSKLGDVMGSPAGKRAMGVAGLGAAMGLNKASQDIATTVGWFKNLKSVAFGALNPFSKGAEVAAVKTGFLSGKLSQLAALAAAHPVIAASMGVAYMAFGDKLTNVAVQGVPKLIKGLDNMGKAAFDATGLYRQLNMEINVTSNSLKKFQNLGMKGNIIKNIRASKVSRADSGFADFSRRADQVMNTPSGRPKGMFGPNRPGAENAVTKSIRRHLELETKRTGVVRQTWDIEKKILKAKQDAEKVTAREGKMTKRTAKERLANIKRIRSQKGRGQENLMLGAGFPLLFGGGVGSVAGGVGGALLGNKMGMGGFGAQILGSAIGTMMDTAVQKAAKLGEALGSLSMDDLLDSGVRLSGELQNQVRLLTRAGEIEKAREALVQRVQQQTGASGQTMKDINNSVNILKAGWNDVVNAVGTTLGILAAPLLAALGGVLTLTSKLFAKLNSIGSAVRGVFVQLGRWAGFTDDAAKSLSDGLNPQLQAAVAKAAKLADQFQRSAGILKQQLEISAAMPTGNTFEAQRGRVEGKLKSKLVGFNADTQSQLGDLRENNKDAPNLAKLEKAFNAKRFVEARELINEASKELDAINQKEEQVVGKIERQNELKASLLGIDQKIGAARLAEDKELEFRLGAQKEIASLSSQLLEDAITAQGPKEKEAKLQEFYTEKKAVELQLEQKIAEFRQKKKDEAENVLTQLQNENNLLQGKIDGNEEEIKQQQTIEKIVDKIGLGYAHQVISLVEKNGQLKEEAENTKKLEAQWQKIKETIATGMTDAIMGLIDGTKSLGESLAGIAKQIASMMLQKAIFTAFKLNAEGGYERGGFQAFASGGVATRPTIGLVGEAGEDEYIIPASKMAASMQRYSAGARGEAVIPGTGSSYAGGGVGGSTTVNYSGPILNFNSEEFVPKSAIGEIINSAAARGAKAGEARTLSSLRNSRSRRGAIGL